MLKERFGEGKRIFLGIPTRLFYKEIKQLLEDFGFEVLGFPYPDDFKYKNFKDRFNNFGRKVFFKDRRYKLYLKYRDTGTACTQFLNQQKDLIDYALIISLDYFPRDIVRLIKEKTKILVGYQWDGFERYLPEKNLIPLFDRFFVFNPIDLQVKNTLPTTNFFIPQALEESSNDIDVFYLGSYVKSRIETIAVLADYLHGLDKNVIFKVFSSKEKIQKAYANSSVEIINQYISYEENLNYVSRSRVVVDILNSVHTGLSFRVFEAMYMQKKLITNNQDIEKYDFYDAQNIYIIKDLNLDGLEEFMNTPLATIPKELLEKYSFENWIKYMLDIAPHQAITLPK